MRGSRIGARTPIYASSRAVATRSARVVTNLLRRQRSQIIAIQAYGIGQQLARDPENAAVIPHVQEMKRLKALRRRKATAGTPAPAPNGTNDPAPKQ